MKTIGLIGKNISYSFSRNYFKNKFEIEHISSIQYINYDIPTIEEVKQILWKPEHIGFNVTIPYKEQIIPYLDRLDTYAQAIGAVNTIYKRNEQWIGGNTDWIGFRDSLLPFMKTTKISALLLGTGGAAKAIIFALQQLRIPFTQVSRTPNAHQLHYKQLDKKVLQQHQLIINCSPVGTFPNVDQAPQIPYEYLEPTHLLYDLIYNPEMTLFLQKGKEKKATTINGYQMLVNQANESWRLWMQIDKKE